MSDPFVAEIRMFGGNFAPTGWATCDGQLLPISQNTALFSLLGTFYGGDGKSTFGLPNMAGCAPMSQGQGPGLSDRFLGETAGEPFVTLINSEMPLHTHTLMGQNSHIGSLPAGGPTLGLAKSAGGNAYTDQTDLITFMDQGSIAPSGSSFPHNNLQPYLCVFFIIAMQGIFPPRG